MELIVEKGSAHLNQVVLKQASTIETTAETPRECTDSLGKRAYEPTKFDVALFAIGNSFGNTPAPQQSRKRDGKETEKKYQEGLRSMNAAIQGICSQLKEKN